jgi:aldose 1-epimerase
MSRFEIESVAFDQGTVCELRDTQTEAFARLWPEFGNNCIAARLALEDDRLVDVLFEPDSLEELRSAPARFGVPLLFPWPGRIPAAQYRFAGRTHTLSAVDARGNAVHGFVDNRPWRVDQMLADEDSATLTCSISSEQHPDTLKGFPFPYRLSVSYQLGASGLVMRANVTNLGEQEMPFGFGAHPYFRLPLALEASRAECTIQLPVTRQWNLDCVGAFTASTSAACPALFEPALGGELDLRHPTPLGQRTFDNVFADPAFENGWMECVRLLISRGAGVNASDAVGETPLFGICTSGSMEIAELLIASGADPDITDNEGFTAADLARAAGQTEAAEYIESRMTRRDHDRGHEAA